MMARPTANGAGRSRDTSQRKRKRATDCWNRVEKNARTERTYIHASPRERREQKEEGKKGCLVRSRRARARSLLLHRCTTDGCILPSFPEPFDGGEEPKNQRRETSASLQLASGPDFSSLSSLSLSLARVEQIARETSKA